MLLVGLGEANTSVGTPTCSKGLVRHFSGELVIALCLLLSLCNFPHSLAHIFIHHIKSPGMMDGSPLKGSIDLKPRQPLA